MEPKYTHGQDWDQFDFWFDIMSGIGRERHTIPLHGARDVPNPEYVAVQIQPSWRQDPKTWYSTHTVCDLECAYLLGNKILVSSGFLTTRIYEYDTCDDAKKAFPTIETQVNVNNLLKEEKLAK
jgi:hypothetical protein